MGKLQEFRSKLGLTETHPVLQVAGLALTVAGAYHGYKRNCGSVGWAIGWSILMPLFAPVALPIALVQGLGKPKETCR